ncbi:hypothetical protein [Rhodocytophaga rosea]|uniref:hypothetical protein n=1 Tax=Rhodocytophaga rosea TaxID=2704465 RepID=UPI001391C9D7|nr:hypothetical protein [Rhodocytophaga rosea]
MKLSETILFSLAVAFLIIGVHQTFTVGILQSYWIFMLSIALLLVFKFQRNKSVEKQPTTSAKPSVVQKKQPGKITKRIRK